MTVGVIAVDRKQLCSEFRDDLYRYPHEVSGKTTSFTSSGIGKRLSFYLKDNVVAGVMSTFEKIFDKSHRVYLGLQSYSYDVHK